MSISSSKVAKLNAQFEKKSAEEILAWAANEFGTQIAFASSFGAEDMVVFDLLSKVKPQIRVFTLDTGRLNEETYELMERARQKYNIKIRSYFPDAEKVEKVEGEKGFYSFRESIENRKECCLIRKVEPLGRALSGLKAWVTGLRREQSVTRTDIQKIELDEAHGGILKINPLADWSHDEVWVYIKQNNVPYSKLHDMGYPSIGCAPCTRAVNPGEDIGGGRWWWEAPEKKECGLH